MKKLTNAAIIFFCSISILFMGTYIYTHYYANGNSFLSSTETTIPEATKASAYTASLPNVMAIDTDFTKAADLSVHAVVHVKVRSKQKRSAREDFLYEYFYGQRPEQPRTVEQSGSGVLISADGYIVTNNHVIANSSDIEIVLNDKHSFMATLVGTDPSTDIALLKIESKEDLPFLQFGNSDALKVGEWVLAVGNPFNLTSTVTAGIVSAKARSINIISGRSKLGIESFIQTDAAVNPGNSGGALVSTEGLLVGINTAIASPTGSYSGYSFAVPVSIVKKVVADLMEYGEVQRALLGVSIADIDKDLAKTYDIEVTEGAFVLGVIEGGAAAIAGLKEGDIITAVNDRKITSVASLQEEISRYRPGHLVKIHAIRKGKKVSFDATLINEQGNTDIVRKQDMSILGATFEELPEEKLRALGLRAAVEVVSLKGGKLKDAGIKEGFIITRVNNRYLSNGISDIEDAIASSEGGIFLTGIYPNGKVAYYAVNLQE